MRNAPPAALAGHHGAAALLEAAAAQVEVGRMRGGETGYGTLRTLKLRCNNLRSPPELATLVEHAAGLTALDLAHNHIGGQLSGTPTVWMTSSVPLFRCR